ncbi:MAG: hypothetical protein HZB51_02460 [Chloroflexi bacterium]|nr:hypothetical protein [Chloroflexota bacterium]
MTQTSRVGLVVLALALAIFGFFAVTLALPNATSVAAAQSAATATATSASTSPSATPTARPTLTTTSPTTTTNTIGNTFWQGLAVKLGINVDMLKAQALQQRNDMIDQAVRDGRLTQDRADRIKQQLAADNLIAPIDIAPADVQPRVASPGNRRSPQLPNFNRGLNPGARVGGPPAELEAVAKVLNLAPSNLLTQLAGGKTLAEIATAQKVDAAVVKRAIIDTRTAEIDRAVTNGFITQAQGASLKANLTPDRIDLTRYQFFFR